MDGFIYYQGNQLKPKTFCDYADKYCSVFQNQVDLPSEGEYPVVVAGYNFFSKLMQEMSGLAYGMGSSLLSGKIGQKIFNDKFTLYQDSDPVTTFDTFFDDEGTINKDFRYDLIKDGVLLTPYTDKKFSQQFNLPHTGAAGSAYDGVPGLSSPSYAVEGSGKTLKELLGGEKAILVLIASGGDFTPEGAYASPVQLAYLIEDGEWVGRLPQLQISSHLFKIFGEDYIGRSSDKIFELSHQNYFTVRMNVRKI